MFSQHIIESFRGTGFLILPNAFASKVVQILRERLTFLFESDVGGIQQKDEWACRSNLRSLSGHQYMLNAWKGEQLVARIATDPELSEAAATLGGWPGVRLAGDTVWWKLPGAQAVPFHQDGLIVRSFLRPSDFLTCWVALDDVSEQVGALQYVPGSHTWPVDDSLELRNSQDHENEDYQVHMLAAASRLGIPHPEILTVSGQAGTCSFHHGLLWHGSPANGSADQPRRAYAILFIRMDSKFFDVPRNPAFAYYKRPDSDELDERHFPITWSNQGYRSRFLSNIQTNPQLTGGDSVFNACLT